MNGIHRRLCRSARWQRTLEQTLLPRALNEVELGQDVLEVGPGPSLTADLLRLRVPHLTAVEIDTLLTASLASRLRGTNVQGDATRLPFEARGSPGRWHLTMFTTYRRGSCRTN